MRRLFGLLLVLVAATVFADDAPPPRIAIIIDDIGDRHAEGRAAIDLPGPVACAFLPHTPYARELATAAHAAGKEVLLHLPLQSLEGKALGPGAITLHTTEAAFVRVLAANLAAIPHVSGVNNHMGSLLTRHPGHMTWLMKALAARGDLYFVDSYTHPDSVALRMAHEARVPAARRDVFLDNEPTPEAIDAQFRRLVAEARRNGSAIGIGHPYPATLEYLREALGRLPEEGVALVPVRELVQPASPEWVGREAPGATPATH